MQCPACSAEIAPGRTFCAACRERGAPPDPHERFYLIVACVAAAGALAIPRLRRSKAFGPTGKVVLGALAVSQTLGAIALIVYLVVNGPALWHRYMQWIRRQAMHQRRSF